VGADVRLLLLKAMIDTQRI